MKKFPILLAPLCFAACQPKQDPEPPPQVESPAETPQSGEIPTPSSFIGLTEGEAAAKATKADLPHRVVQRDGQSLPVTRDYRPERLNFTIENDKVTAVTNG
jgi:hypothetical protein